MLLLFALPTLSVAVDDPYGFYTNDYIQPTTDVLNVRGGAGTSYAILGSVSTGDPGTIEGGPTYNDGYWWWRFNGVNGDSHY